MTKIDIKYYSYRLRFSAESKPAEGKLKKQTKIKRFPLPMLSHITNINSSKYKLTY